MNPFIDAKEIARDALIKPFEGCARFISKEEVKAYPDPGTKGHPWTIGYGSTGPEINSGTVWSIQRCEQELNHHIDYFMSGLFRMSPSLKTENPKRIAGVLSWVYNCGLGNYRISTFKKRIDSKDWAGAAKECLKWNKAAGRVLPGLTKRRTAEAMMIK